MLDKPLTKSLKQKLIASPRIKSFTLTLRGRSMRPFIKDGTRVKLRKIGPGRQPAVGDVVGIRYRNGILVHRILAIRGRGDDREYFTKGDWRLVGDGWVGENKIAGIMIREKRHQRIIDLAAAGFSSLLWCGGKLLRRRRK